MKQIVSWDEELSPSDSVDVLLDLSYLHARESGVFCETLLGFLDRRDFAGLCAWQVPYDSCNSEDARAARQTQAFFQKSEWLELPGVDKEAAAWETYQRSELLCKETNDIFTNHANGRISFPPAVEAVLYRAQRKIAMVLGGVPDLADLGLRFGPGATATINKRDASWRSKLHRRVTCSESLAPYASRVLNQMPHLLDIHAVLDKPLLRTDYDDFLLTKEDSEEFERRVAAGYDVDAGEVRGKMPIEICSGVLSFVPKKPSTFRAVCTQPLLNSLMQNAVGDYMARRAKRFGLDLSSQERNRTLAWIGSLTGALATLDLSNASDTLATQLVYHLLPLDWCLFLDLIRVQDVSYKGVTRREEKFVSMGNGFTFPLESIIFWALVSAVSTDPTEVSVFGDDIICPVGDVPLVTKVLSTCGFTVNSLKSYSRGSFRESCGKDYLRGIDIRPFYQKLLVSGATLFTLHNFYIRTGHADKAAYVLDKWIAEPLRIFGPDGYGDGHLIGEHPRTPHRADDGWGGYIFHTYTWLPKRDFKARAGDYVLPLYAIYQRGEIYTPLARRRNKYGSELIGVSLPGRSGYKMISIYTF